MPVTPLLSPYDDWIVGPIKRLRGEHVGAVVEQS